MEASTRPEEESGIAWVAGWGDQIKVGDLLRVTKLGGAVRIINLRKFKQPSPNNEDGWFYGAVVEDPGTQQYHLFVQPHEAVWIALETPTDSEGAQSKGEDDRT